MKFHLDEHVDHAIAAALLRRAIDVTTSADRGLLGATDEEQLSFAASERRVIITHDHDFLHLHSLGVPHAGIAYCRSGSRSIGEIVRHLILMHECLEESEVRSSIEYL